MQSIVFITRVIVIRASIRVCRVQGHKYRNIKHKNQVDHVKQKIQSFTPRGSFFSRNWQVLKFGLLSSPRKNTRQNKAYKCHNKKNHEKTNAAYQKRQRDYISYYNDESN